MVQLAYSQQELKQSKAADVVAKISRIRFFLLGLSVLQSQTLRARRFFRGRQPYSDGCRFQPCLFLRLNLLLFIGPSASQPHPCYCLSDLVTFVGSSALKPCPTRLQELVTSVRAIGFFSLVSVQDLVILSLLLGRQLYSFAQLNFKSPSLSWGPSAFFSLVSVQDLAILSLLLGRQLYSFTQLNLKSPSLL